MAGNLPTDVKPINLDKIKANLLKPALTSQYIVNITTPENGFINARVKNSLSQNYDKLSLACVEASLPGSSLATIDIDNDYAGVSEKHGYRRIYDDRIDFTFFVDSSEYYSIRFFEAWIAYVVNEQKSNNDVSFDDPNYTYRVNYPQNYYADNLSIIKFEKDFDISTIRNNISNLRGNSSGKYLTYKFINAFPISIGSMPVSYEQSSLLKCTVSFSYSRYRIDDGYERSSNNNQNTFYNNSQIGIDATGLFGQTGFNLNQQPLSGQPLF